MGCSASNPSSSEAFQEDECNNSVQNIADSASLQGFTGPPASSVVEASGLDHFQDAEDAEKSLHNFPRLSDALHDAVAKTMTRIPLLSVKSAAVEIRICRIGWHPVLLVLCKVLLKYSVRVFYILDPRCADEPRVNCSGSIGPGSGYGTEAEGRYAMIQIEDRIRRINDSNVRRETKRIYSHTELAEIVRSFQALPKYPWSGPVSDLKGIIEMFSTTRRGRPALVLVRHGPISKNWCGVYIQSFDEHGKTQLEHAQGGLFALSTPAAIEYAKFYADWLPNQNVTCDQLRKGDHVFTHRAAPWLNGPLYDHHGIYAGNGNVLHFLIDENGRSSVMYDPIDVFRTDPKGVRHPIKRYEYGVDESYFNHAENATQDDRKPGFGTCNQSPALDVEEVLKEAVKIRLNPWTYDSATCNCEHFALWCKARVEPGVEIGQTRRIKSSATTVAKHVGPMATAAMTTAVGIVAQTSAAVALTSTSTSTATATATMLTAARMGLTAASIVAAHPATWITVTGFGLLIGCSYFIVRGAMKWVDSSSRGCCTSDVGTPDLYAMLEVPKDASQGTIRKAYYKMAKKCHPDRSPENDPNKEEKKVQFVNVLGAYEVLSDVKKREDYDQNGHLPREAVFDVEQQSRQPITTLDEVDVMLGIDGLTTSLAALMKAATEKGKRKFKEVQNKFFCDEKKAEEEAAAKKAEEEAAAKKAEEETAAKKAEEEIATDVSSLFDHLDIQGKGFLCKEEVFLILRCLNFNGDSCRNELWFSAMQKPSTTSNNVTREDFITYWLDTSDKYPYYFKMSQSALNHALVEMRRSVPSLEARLEAETERIAIWEKSFDESNWEYSSPRIESKMPQAKQSEPATAVTREEEEMKNARMIVNAGFINRISVCNKNRTTSITSAPLEEETTSIPSPSVTCPQLPVAATAEESSKPPDEFCCPIQEAVPLLFLDMMDELNEMGFQNQDQNKKMLDECNGNLEDTVKGLINLERAGRH